jgi:hypothetical protein
MLPAPTRRREHVQVTDPASSSVGAEAPNAPDNVLVEALIGPIAIGLVALVLGVALYRSRPRPGEGSRRLAVPVLLALSLVGIPLWAFLSGQFVDSTDFFVPATTQTAEDSRVDPSPQSCDLLGEADIAEITVTRFDPSTSSLVANVSMCLARSTLASIRRPNPKSSRGQKSRLFNVESGVIRAREPTAQFFFTLRGTLPVEYISRTVTASAISGAADPGLGMRLPTRVGAFTLRLIGRPRRYPLDQYSLDTELWLRLPRGTVMRRHKAADDESFIPLHIRLRVEPSARDFVWRYDSSGAGKASEAGRLAIIAQRPTKVKLFVFALILMPIVLFLAVLAVVPMPDSDDGSAAAILLGVAAFLLAVLPIRQFVVPPDVSTLTNIDLALGTQMATMVAVAVILAHGHRSARRGSRK